MALHSRKQLAVICGLDYDKSSDRGKIGMAITRGKIILSGDFIDDTISENARFIAVYQAKNENAEAIKEQVESNEDSVSKSPAYKQPEKKQPVPNVSAPKKGGDLFALDKLLKEQELEKKAAETRLLNLKESKIRGESMPTVLTQNLFMIHNQSVLTIQKDIIEDLFIEVAKEARLTGDQLARLRGKMTNTLNEGMVKAIAVTGKNIKSFMEEFSIKREVGEHD